jgi:putative transposase/transposase-like zinc-binding protein
VGLELADLVRQYGPAYHAKYANRLLPSHQRALRDIAQCRTAALGGQVYTCAQCDQVVHRYHCCRNRHCPKCQHEQAQQWLAQQQALLLPAPYFLLTFTLPAALPPIARRHQRLIYDVLFRASAAATQQLAQDPRFIGGQLGLVGVLHSWTRDLRYHPHVHYLVPAEGLAADGVTWHPARRNFLLPVKALSRLVRGHFRDAVQKTPAFTEIPADVWTHDWVVHCKPVGTGQTALKYLAPYIFRVALSHRRLVKLANDQVTFCYTDAASRQTKFCTLPAEQFLHRFLQHVLPKGFVKVRYYGFFAPSARPRLAALQQQLGQRATETLSPTDHAAVTPLANPQLPEPRRSGAEVPCPVCGQAMQVRSLLRPSARCPP